MGKRKYPEVKGYWVYSIKVVSIGKYYIGVSKQQCYRRWKKSDYEKTALSPYLQEWESMKKNVLIDGLSKEQAYQYEGNIIQALSMKNLCINTNRSGLITEDKNAYNKELRKNNPELRERLKQYDKQYRIKNKEKIREQRRQHYLKKK